MTVSGVQLTICRMGEKSSNFIDDIAHQSEDQPEVQLCHLCARHVCEEMYSQTLKVPRSTSHRPQTKCLCLPI